MSLSAVILLETIIFNHFSEDANETAATSNIVSSTFTWLGISASNYQLKSGTKYSLYCGYECKQNGQQCECYFRQHTVVRCIEKKGKTCTHSLGAGLPVSTWTTCRGPVNCGESITTCLTQNSIRHRQSSQGVVSCPTILSG